MPFYEIKILKNNYNDSQTKLINIWNDYIKRINNNLPYKYILLEKSRSKSKTKTNIRKIAGIKAYFVRYINEKTEIVRMSEINFVLLMAKMGIEFEIKEININV